MDREGYGRKLELVLVARSCISVSVIPVLIMHRNISAGGEQDMNFGDIIKADRQNYVMNRRTEVKCLKRRSGVMRGFCLHSECRLPFFLRFLDIS